METGGGQTKEQIGALLAFREVAEPNEEETGGHGNADLGDFLIEIEIAHPNHQCQEPEWCAARDGPGVQENAEQSVDHKHAARTVGEETHKGRDGGEGKFQNLFSVAIIILHVVFGVLVEANGAESGEQEQQGCNGCEGTPNGARLFAVEKHRALVAANSRSNRPKNIMLES